MNDPLTLNKLINSHKNNSSLFYVTINNIEI